MTWILILWTLNKSGTLHFTQVRGLPDEASCVALAKKVAVSEQYHCAPKDGK